MAGFSLVHVDGDYNILGEVERVADLPTAIRRLRELEAVDAAVDLIDLDTARFVPVPAWTVLA